jgi:alcohol dehydrogenase class IV
MVIDYRVLRMAGQFRDFDYAGIANHVVFGAGASGGPRFVDAVRTVGANRLLLVAAEAEAGLADRIAGALEGLVVARFSRVLPHVPVEVAQEARAAARDAAADGVLSVGGGSTTGTAKAIALELGLPIIAVPTTYAGSEVTPVWGITERSRKTTGTDRRVLPKLVVYDPELTLTLPPGLSGTSGMNAVAHSAEALWSPRHNPITSLIAEESIRALASGLPAVVADPSSIEARSQALYGAWLAGTAFANVGSYVHHKICHVLGGAYNLPHAETHTVVLPYAASVAASRVRGADARIAAAVGRAAEVDPNLSAAAALSDLNERLGAPRSVRELGLRDDQLDEAVALVGETLAALPDPFPPAQVEALIRAAFAGEPFTVAAAA